MAYTYLIGWTKYNKWYYGVRFSKNCKSEELWKNYFTSSKHVKQFRSDNGEPDIIQIRKTFSDKYKAINWENTVLKRMNVVLDSKWLNKTDNKSICPIAAAKANKGKPSPRKGIKGVVKLTDQQRLNISNGKTGTLWWNNGILEVRSRHSPGPDFVRGRSYKPNDVTKLLIGAKSLGNSHNKGRSQTEQEKRKRSESGKGISWWTDGTNQIKSRTCPPGYVKGRIRMRRQNRQPNPML